MSYLQNDNAISFMLYIVAVVVLLFSSRVVLVSDTPAGTEEEIYERTLPVGKVRIATVSEASLPTEVDDKGQDKDEGKAGQGETRAALPQAGSKQDNTGETVARASCFTCHQHGLMNAPKVGDAEEWGKRISKGFDQLLANALKGINTMPAKGANPDLEDLEVEHALLYMLTQSGVTVSGKTPVAVNTAVNPVKATTVDLAAAKPVPVAAAVEVTSANREGMDDQAARINSQTDFFQAAEPDFILTEAAQEAIAIVQTEGRDSYASQCASCHDSGSGNAPVTGKQQDWLASFSTGVEVLSRKIGRGKPPHKDVRMTEAQITSAINFIMQETFWPTPD